MALSVEQCYRVQVWNLQCKYSGLVEKYVNNLILGMGCDKQFENLKMFRRVLMLLNRYDVRDIAPDTTDYNVLPYSTIIDLLETLTKKY